MTRRLARRLLAQPLYFMHEIRETSDVRFMPEIFLDKCLTLKFHGHQSMKLQLSYEIVGRW